MLSLFIKHQILPYLANLKPLKQLLHLTLLKSASHLMLCAFLQYQYNREATFTRSIRVMALI